jgi:hypothetical protein
MAKTAPAAAEVADEKAVAETEVPVAERIDFNDPTLSDAEAVAAALAKQAGTPVPEADDEA